MRALLIVILPPGFDLPPRIPQTGEPVRVQAFIALSPVETFHIGILYRLSRLNELQSYSPFLTPGSQYPTAELRSVVRNNRFRQTSLRRHSVEHTSDSPSPSDVSTSIAGHSRVQSSTSVNIRIAFPLLTQSLTRSIDQRSFGLSAAGLTAVPFHRIRRRCRMRIARPSS